MLRSKVARYFSYLLLFVLLSGLLSSQAVLAQETPSVTPTGPQPTITSFTPTSALKGTTVVITGTNLNGATAVEFGGYAASSFKVDSATQITAVVDKRGSGDVTVTTPGGTASKSGFHFLMLEMERKYAIVSGEATDTFSTDVDINYQMPDKRRFNINVTPPKDWYAYAQSYDSATRIAALELTASDMISSTERITVKFMPLYSSATPGDYVTKLEVSAGELKASIDLTARISAKYAMSLSSTTGTYNARATAGSDSRFTIQIINGGTASLENITFSTENPEGWNIKFDPEKVGSIDTGLTKDVDIIINAPKGKTVAGDYMIKINANTEQSKANADIRVTVSTPSIWGWVGIVIVLVIIAGLAVAFRQMGRRR